MQDSDSAEYLYDGICILILINNFIRSCGSRFRNGNIESSFFKDGVPKKAALIVSKEEGEYCSTGIILSRSLRYNKIKSDIEVVIDLFFREKENNVEQNMEIIFPYEVEAEHWALGRLIIDEKDKIANIEVFDPLMPGRMMSFEMIMMIKSELCELGGCDYLVDQVDVVNVYNYRKQQSDASSSGVITVENIKGILIPNKNYLYTVYESGAKKVRNEHLLSVKDDKNFQRWIQTAERLDKVISLYRNIWRLWKKTMLQVSENVKNSLIRSIDNDRHHLKYNSNIAEEEGRRKIRNFIDTYVDKSEMLYYLTGTSETINYIYKRIRDRDLTSNEERIEEDVGFLRRTTHGDMYQLALTSLVAIRAKVRDEEFDLYGEDKGFEMFDDLIINYRNKNKITLVQVKHNANGNGFYNRRDFLNSKGGDASLYKYFDSWFSLKQRKDLMKKKLRYIFITNRKIKIKDDLIKIRDDSIFEDEFFGLEGYTYKFKKNGNKIKDYIGFIYENSKKIGEMRDADNIYHEALRRKYSSLVESLKKNPSHRFDGRTFKTGSVAQYDKLALVHLIETDEMARKNMGFPEDFIPNFTATATSSSLKGGLFNHFVHTEINEFLDEFILKIEQPGLFKMMEILREEFGSQVEICSNEFFESIWFYLIKWFSKDDTSLLTSEEFTRVIDETKGNLQRFYLLQDTRLFKEKAEAHKDERKYSEISNFLKSKENVAYILFDGPIDLIVYRSIRGYIFKNYKDDEWIYISDKKKIPILEEVLKGSSTKLAILDHRNSLKDMSKIVECAKEHKKKLILLVSEGYISLLNERILSPQEIILTL